MVFQSIESTALIWVLFLQTHPLALSLSEPPHSSHSTAPVTSAPHNLIWWGQQPGACVQRVRERPKKARGWKRETKSFAVSASNWQLKLIPSYQTDTHTCHEPSQQEAKNNTDLLCPIFPPPSSDSLIRFLLNLRACLERKHKQECFGSGITPENVLAWLNLLAGHWKVAGSIPVKNGLWSTNQTTVHTNSSCPSNAFHALLRWFTRTCCCWAETRLKVGQEGERYVAPSSGCRAFLQASVPVEAQVEKYLTGGKYLEAVTTTKPDRRHFCHSTVL